MWRRAFVKMNIRGNGTWRKCESHAVPITGDLQLIAVDMEAAFDFPAQLLSLRHADVVVFSGTTIKATLVGRIDSH